MNRLPVRLLRGRDCLLDLSRPCIMGVLNVTPDSFSDGGRYVAPQRALEQGLAMERDGADLLDVGGESTRPGALPIAVDEELERVVPVIEALRRETALPISIDTNKASVAREAMAAGANFINDISGLNFDPQMVEVAAESSAGLFLMHTRGRPEVMQRNTDYLSLRAAVAAGLRQSVAIAEAAGISLDRLAIDPGIGFGKSVTGNLELLHHLEELHRLKCPLLVGTSRKSFIGEILQQDDPLRRLSGTLATITVAVMQGVQIVRVHDVRPAREAALVAWAIREKKCP